MKIKRHFRQLKNDHQEEFCCDVVVIRKRYRGYHRFFISSSIMLLSVIIIAWFASQGRLTGDAFVFLWGLLGLVAVKELVSILISRRIYDHILKPVEELKNGLFEVSRGNYGYKIAPTRAPEISELIRVFNNMSQQLHESEREKSAYETSRRELIASISHDLKTPITSINGYIDGIVEGVADSPEKRDAYYKIIQQNARYMNKLIDDLSLYSQLDLHKLYFECSCLNVNNYVSEVFEELYLELEEQGVEMQLFNRLREPVSLVIDAKLMTRVIRNIVNNAIAYGRPTGARIEFELLADRDRDGVVLKIKDNGPGIEKERLDKIFERFYRGEGSRSGSVGSSGLGLAIAKEVVSAHGGKIWAESTLGEGTTICILLQKNMEATLCQKHGF